jgi:hypothetical protein
MTAATTLTPAHWRWLLERPHPWRRQLWVKGRKLLASAVWLDALTNGMGPREAAENWDLPQEACEEIFAYCEANKALTEAEANVERQILEESADRDLYRTVRARMGDTSRAIEVDIGDL